MKIAFYLPHLADGGVARSSFLLADQFVKHGHMVDVLTIRPSEAMTMRPPDGVHLIDLRAGRAFTSIPALVRYLRRTQPDALIAAQHFANVSAVLARMIARGNTKLVLTERLSIGEALIRDGGLRRLVLPRLIRWSYPRADAVVANSGDNADELSAFLGWPSGRVPTIYNPTADPAIPEMAKEQVDEDWFGEDAPPVVISVGRLAPQKDFETLVRAFAQVHREVPSRLIIVGEGPDRATLEALAQELGVADDVMLPGHRENPYVYMARSALFALSSRYEGLPNALIEAQACGVPCLSTDCPTGPREILMDGAAGVLVPVGDVDAMATQMRMLLTDRAAAEKLVEAATRHLDRFSPDVCYEAYMALMSA